MADKVLVIDDDVKLLDLLKRILKASGFEVFTAASGEEGLELFFQVEPDIVILDIMMPGKNGWEVCRELRKKTTVPILMLTALDNEDHIVKGLMNGADDYVVKPFKPRELVARLNALLRRSRMQPREAEILRFGNGDLVINQTERRVFAYGKEVELTPIEFELLAYMARRAGRILPPQQLFEAVWGMSSDASIQSVKWYIWSLRRKLEQDPSNPRFILTERGIGYRFSPD